MQTKHSSNNEIFVVSHPDQLLQILKTAMAKTVVLQPPSLAPHEISYWENKLMAEKNACGCGEGAAFLLIMLVGLVILNFSGLPLFPKSTVIKTLLCAALAFMSIGIGKAFGHYRATRRLTQSVYELNIILNNRHLYPH